MSLLDVLVQPCDKNPAISSLQGFKSNSSHLPALSSLWHHRWSLAINWASHHVLIMTHGAALGTVGMRPLWCRTWSKSSLESGARGRGSWPASWAATIRFSLSKCITTTLTAKMSTAQLDFTKTVSLKQTCSASAAQLVALYKTMIDSQLTWGFNISLTLMTTQWKQTFSWTSTTA